MNKKTYIKHNNKNSKERNSLITKSLFINKLNSLEKELKRSILSEPIELKSIHIPEECKYTVFLSICDGKTRAHVRHASAGNFEEAFLKTRTLIEKLIEKEKINPIWVKAEVVDFVQRLPYSRLKEVFLSAKYQKFFRMGFSLDTNMEMAFLEAEANSYKIYDYTVIPMKASKPGHDQVPCINVNQLKQYLNWNGDDRTPEIGEYIYCFNCRSFFLDQDNKIYKLYDRGMHCGRRELMIY